MKVTFECQHCHTFHLLEEMYYCLNCNQFLCSCSSCVFAELDYCYCPVCFKSKVKTEFYQNHYQYAAFDNFNLFLVVVIAILVHNVNHN